jgi:hypothetical protein
MSFWRWLLVLLRLTGEAVVLGFTWHHSHWSVALTLTGLTANMELEQLIKHLQHAEDEMLAEKGRMLQRLRNLN